MPLLLVKLAHDLLLAKKGPSDRIFELNAALVRKRVDQRSVE
jgi:hypothetical protein